mmetsp:Transcript_21493/g.54956  ORF Transcript_21493/g.54956 Transcript_21493/m.54956 type:complete len:243 (-) Transcript_21493:12-740(-)
MRSHSPNRKALNSRQQHQRLHRRKLENGPDASNLWHHRCCEAYERVDCNNLRYNRHEPHHRIRAVLALRHLAGPEGNRDRHPNHRHEQRNVHKLQQPSGDPGHKRLRRPPHAPAARRPAQAPRAAVLQRGGQDLSHSFGPANTNEQKLKEAHNHYSLVQPPQHLSHLTLLGRCRPRQRHDSLKGIQRNHEHDSNRADSQPLAPVEQQMPPYLVERQTAGHRSQAVGHPDHPPFCHPDYWGGA